jgi:hypothetical protein
MRLWIAAKAGILGVIPGPPRVRMNRSPRYGFVRDLKASGCKWGMWRFAGLYFGFDPQGRA